MSEAEDKLKDTLKAQQRYKRTIKSKRLMRKVTSGFQKEEQSKILTYANAMRETGHSQKQIEEAIRKKFIIDVKKPRREKKKKPPDVIMGILG